MTEAAAALDQEVREIVIGPQAGPQSEFDSCRADIAIMGGAAGGGKSYSLLMEPLKYVQFDTFDAVIFRRTYEQIKKAGSLWDTSQKLYRVCGALPNMTSLTWRFPTGAKLKFGHMQREDDRFAWDGSQIAFIGFDQLESFTEKQFMYMLSRNRSLCPVKPHIRATCNPVSDHWLRYFLDWWIGDDGFPIYERSGKLRWFVRLDDEIIWADSPDELDKKFGDKSHAKSVTFIPSKVTDNKILINHDPEYIAALQALPKIERGRLLHGNWDIRESAGEYFQRHWFEVVKSVPAGGEKMRYWDRAATKAQQGTEAKASWTAGLLLNKHPSGIWFIEHVVRFQGTPLEVERAIDDTASQDGKDVEVGIEGDPGQAGKAEAEAHVRRLGAKGYTARANFVHESKGTRAKAPSAQAEAGNIKLVSTGWDIEAFLREAVNFDGSKECVSDQIDALSGNFMMLADEPKMAGVWGRG